jgi:hypothetical protein
MKKAFPVGLPTKASRLCNHLGLEQHVGQPLSMEPSVLATGIETPRGYVMGSLLV